MVISRDPPFEYEEAIERANVFQRTYDEAIVYADMDAETVLHEGAVGVSERLIRAFDRPPALTRGCPSHRPPGPR